MPYCMDIFPIGDHVKAYEYIHQNGITDETSEPLNLNYKDLFLFFCIAVLHLWALVNSTGAK